MREKLSAESVIAATVASFRNTRTTAHDIAKTVIRDLNHFGYDIQPRSKALNDEVATGDRRQARGVEGEGMSFRLR